MNSFLNLFKVNIGLKETHFKGLILLVKMCICCTCILITQQCFFLYHNCQTIEKLVVVWWAEMQGCCHSSGQGLKCICIQFISGHPCISEKHCSQMLLFQYCCHYFLISACRFIFFFYYSLRISLLPLSSLNTATC